MPASRKVPLCTDASVFTKLSFCFFRMLKTFEPIRKMPLDATRVRSAPYKAETEAKKEGV